jgi:hypothetical protein
VLVGIASVWGECAQLWYTPHKENPKSDKTHEFRNLLDLAGECSGRTKVHMLMAKSGIILREADALRTEQAKSKKKSKAKVWLERRSGPPAAEGPQTRSSSSLDSKRGRSSVLLAAGRTGAGRPGWR